MNWAAPWSALVHKIRFIFFYSAGSHTHPQPLHKILLWNFENCHMRVAWIPILKHLQKFPSRWCDTAIPLTSLLGLLAAIKGRTFIFLRESSLPCPLLQYKLYFKLMRDQRVWSKLAVSGPCQPSQPCEQGFITPCLQHKIRIELSTKPCILLCLYLVYINDNKSTRRAKRWPDWPRKWEGRGGPSWCCLMLPSVYIHWESMLFHRQAANAPVFLLTCVNFLFI